ncbi:MAG: hypothetical protein HC802_03320 [Caldilineaceae bacterium]|nr:hypothetical protein [Caldilineaceae bacterium]
MNPGDVEAVRVEFSNEAPAGLEWIDASAAGGGEIRREPGNGGAALLVVSWPTLGAQESISVTFTAKVASEIEDGAVIRNLVVANARNAADAPASFRIGMPPTQLPDFR